MSKTIKITAEIALTIGDETLVLTRAEAEQLHRQLGATLYPPAMPGLQFPSLKDALKRDLLIRGGAQQNPNNGIIGWPQGPLASGDAANFALANQQAQPGIIPS